MDKRHRVFIAINLPQDIKRELAKYEEKYPDVPAKWTSRDNLHITLVFLGEITDVEIADVCNIVRQFCESQKSFAISLKKISYGPENKLVPRYVWAVGEKSKELQELKNNLENALLEKVRFRPEERGFTPHITMARISEWEFKQIEPEERPEVDAGIDLFFTVESIEVMESQLKKGGPQYTILESHELQQ